MAANKGSGISCCYIKYDLTIPKCNNQIYVFLPARSLFLTKEKTNTNNLVYVEQLLLLLLYTLSMLLFLNLYQNHSV